MTTTTTLGIDFSTFPSSDGLPMAETEANADQMIDSGDLLLPVQPGPDGRVSSTILPFSLQVVGDRLRAIDAVSGQLCATPDEEREARMTEQAAHLAEQAARMAEHEARVAAETRAAAAESALRDALVALARQRPLEEQR